MLKWLRWGLLLGLLGLLFGCNWQGAPSSDTASRVSLGINRPMQGVFTNDLGVEVRVSATGATVTQVTLVYRGETTSGSLPLTSQRGVWVGQLPDTLPSGQYALKAEARLQGGGAAISSSEVTFTLDREPPEISILEPLPSPLAHGSASIRIRASDGLSGIQEVFLQQGNNVVARGTLLEADEYRLTLDVSTLREGVPFSVVAKDRAGNERREPLNLVVDRQAPTVVWRQPADGAQVSGTVTLEVEATDNVGVAKVEFFAGSTKLGEATSAPYTFAWNTAGYPDGPVTLRARAVDTAGNASEATLQVTVANAPEIYWVNPVANGLVAGFVLLEAEVRALRSVDRVEFYFGSSLDSLSKIPGTPTVSGSLYSLAWDVLRVTPGAYFLKAVVIDVAGARSEAVIPVQVGSAFVLDSPSDGDQVGPGANRIIVAVTVGVRGTLPPGVSITQVEVYINGYLAGTAVRQTATDGSEVYVFSWDTRISLPPGHDPNASGDRVITAQVYYTGGDTFTNGVRVLYLP
jgi:hypothetical protein